MITVLCEPFDLAALETTRRLRDRAVQVDLFTTDDLSRAARVVHFVGPRNEASVTWTLQDGRVCSSSSVGGVLNRLVAPPPRWLTGLAAEDRDYSNQELFAFFLSWLHALPGPMLNRPSPMGLSGAWRHDTEWAVLAAQAGLNTLPFRIGPNEPDGMWEIPEAGWHGVVSVTVFVVGEQVVGAPPAGSVEHGCLRLAELSKTDLLGIDLISPGTGVWTFMGASPCPDLRLGGDALLEALATALTER